MRQHSSTKAVASPRPAFRRHRRRRSSSTTSSSSSSSSRQSLSPILDGAPDYFSHRARRYRCKSGPSNLSTAKKPPKSPQSMLHKLRQRVAARFPARSLSPPSASSILDYSKVARTTPAFHTSVAGMPYHELVQAYEELVRQVRQADGNYKHGVAQMKGSIDEADRQRLEAKALENEAVRQTEALRSQHNMHTAEVLALRKKVAELEKGLTEEQERSQLLVHDNFNLREELHDVRAEKDLVVHHKAEIEEHLANVQAEMERVQATNAEVQALNAEMQAEMKSMKAEYDRNLADKQSRLEFNRQEFEKRNRDLHDQIAKSAIFEVDIKALQAKNRDLEAYVTALKASNTKLEQTHAEVSEIQRLLGEIGLRVEEGQPLTSPAVVKELKRLQEVSTDLAKRSEEHDAMRKRIAELEAHVAHAAKEHGRMSTAFSEETKKMRVALVQEHAQALASSAKTHTTLMEQHKARIAELEAKLKPLEALKKQVQEQQDLIAQLKRVNTETVDGQKEKNTELQAEKTALEKQLLALQAKMKEQMTADATALTAAAEKVTRGAQLIAEYAKTEGALREAQQVAKYSEACRAKVEEFQQAMETYRLEKKEENKAQVKKKLQELRQVLKASDDDVAGHSDRLQATLAGKRAELEDQLQEVQEAMRDGVAMLGAESKTATDYVRVCVMQKEAVQKQLAVVERALEITATGEVKSIEARMAAVQIKMKEIQDERQRQHEALEKKIREFTTQAQELAGVKAELASVREKCAALESQVKTVKENLAAKEEEMQRRQKSFSDTISRLRNTVVASDAEKFHEEMGETLVEEHLTTMSQLQQDKAELEKRLEAIVESKRKTESENKRLQGLSSKIEKKLSKYQSKNTKLNEFFSTLLALINGQGIRVGGKDNYEGILAELRFVFDAYDRQTADLDQKQQELARLTAQVRELTQEKTLYEHELGELFDLSANFRSKVDGYIRPDSFKEQMDNIRDVMNALQRKETDALSKYHDAQRKADDYETRLQALQRQLDEGTTSKKDLEAKLIQLEDKLRRYTSVDEQATTRIAQLETACEEANARSLLLQKELEALQTQKDQSDTKWESKNAELEAAVADVTTRLEALSTLRDDLTRQKQKAQEEASEKSAALAELKARQKADEEKYNAELHALQREKALLQQELDGRVGRLEASANDKGKVVAELEKQIAAFEQTSKSTFEQLQAEKETLSAQMASSKSEVERLQKELKASQDSVKERSLQLTKLQETQAQAAKNHRESEATHAAQVAKLEADLKTSRDSAAKGEARIQELEQALAAEKEAKDRAEAAKVELQTVANSVSAKEQEQMLALLQAKSVEEVSAAVTQIQTLLNETADTSSGWIQRVQGALQQWKEQTQEVEVVKATLRGALRAEAESETLTDLVVRIQHAALTVKAQKIRVAEIARALSTSQQLPEEKLIGDPEFQDLIFSVNAAIGEKRKLENTLQRLSTEIAGVLQHEQKSLAEELSGPSRNVVDAFQAVKKRVEELQIQLRNHETGAKEQEARTSKLQTDLETLRAQEVNLREQLRTQGETFRTKIEEYDAAVNYNAQRLAEKETLSLSQGQAAENQQELVEKEQVIQDLEERVRRSEEELGRVRKEKEKVEEWKYKLEKEHETAHTELTSLKATSEELQRAKEDLVRALEMALEKAHEEAQRHEAEKTDFETILRQHQQEINEIKSQLQQAYQENENKMAALREEHEQTLTSLQAVYEPLLDQKNREVQAQYDQDKEALQKEHERQVLELQRQLEEAVAAKQKVEDEAMEAAKKANNALKVEEKRHEEQVRALHDKHQREIEESTKRYEEAERLCRGEFGAKTSALEVQLRAELDAKEAEYERRIAQKEQELQDAKANYEAEKNILQEAHAKVVREHVKTVRKSKEDLSKIMIQLRKDLKEKQGEIKKEMDKARTQMTETVEKMQRQITEEQRQLSAKHEQAMKDLRENHAQALATQHERQQVEIQRLNSEYALEIERLRHEFKTNCSSAEVALSAQITELQQEKATLQAQLQTDQRTITTQKEQILSLQSDLRRVDLDSQRVVQQLAILDTQNRELSGTLQVLQTELADNKVQTDLIRQGLAQALEREAALHQQNANLSATNTDLLTKHSTVTTELIAAQQAKTTLEAELKAKKEECERVKTELGENTAALQNAQTTVTQQKATLEEKGRQLEEEQKTNLASQTTLKEQLTQKTAEIATLEKKQQEYADRLSQSEKQKLAAEAQLTEEKAAKARLQVEVDRLTEEKQQKTTICKDNEATLTANQKRIAELEEQLRTKEGEKSALEARLAECQGQLQGEIATTGNLRTQVAQLNETKEKNEASIALKQKEKLDLETKLQEALNQQAASAAALEALQQAKAKVESDLATEQAKSQILDQDLKTLQGQKETWTTEKARHEAKIAALEQKERELEAKLATALKEKEDLEKTQTALNEKKNKVDQDLEAKEKVNQELVAQIKEWKAKEETWAATETKMKDEAQTAATSLAEEKRKSQLHLTSLTQLKDRLVNLLAASTSSGIYRMPEEETNLYAHLESLTGRWTEMKRTQDQAEAAGNTLDELKVKIAAAEAREKALEHTYTTLTQDKTAVESTLAALRREIADATREKDTLLDVVKKKKLDAQLLAESLARVLQAEKQSLDRLSLDAPAKKKKELNEELPAVKALVKKLTTLEAQLAETRTAKSTAQTAFDEATRANTTLEAEIAALKTELRDLTGVALVTEKTVMEKTQELERMNATVKTLTDDKIALEARKTKLEKEKTDLQTSVNAEKAKEELSNTLKPQFQELVGKIAAAEKEKQEISEAITTINVTIEAMNTSLQELKKQLPDSRIQMDRVRAIQGQPQYTQEMVNAKIAELAKFQAENQLELSRMSAFFDGLRTEYQTQLLQVQQASQQKEFNAAGLVELFSQGLVEIYTSFARLDVDDSVVGIGFREHVQNLLSTSNLSALQHLMQEKVSNIVEKMAAFVERGKLQMAASQQAVDACPATQLEAYTQQYNTTMQTVQLKLAAMLQVLKATPAEGEKSYEIIERNLEVLNTAVANYQANMQELARLKDVETRFQHYKETVQGRADAYTAETQAKLQAEREAMRITLEAQVQSEVEGLRAKLSSALEDVSRVRDQLDTSRAKLERLTGEKETYESENENLHNQIVSLRDHLRVTQTELEQVRRAAQSNSLVQEKYRIEKELRDSESHRMRLDAENVKLHENRKTLTDENAKLSRQVRVLEDNLDRTSQELSALKDARLYDVDNIKRIAANQTDTAAHMAQAVIERDQTKEQLRKLQLEYEQGGQQMSRVSQKVMTLLNMVNLTTTGDIEKDLSQLDRILGQYKDMNERNGQTIADFTQQIFTLKTENSNLAKLADSNKHYVSDIEFYRKENLSLGEQVLSQEGKRKRLVAEIETLEGEIEHLHRVNKALVRMGADARKELESVMAENVELREQQTLKSIQRNITTTLQSFSTDSAAHGPDSVMSTGSTEVIKENATRRPREKRTGRAKKKRDVAEASPSSDEDDMESENSQRPLPSSTVPQPLTRGPTLGTTSQHPIYFQPSSTSKAATALAPTDAVTSLPSWSTRNPYELTQVPPRSGMYSHDTQVLPTSGLLPFGHNRERDVDMPGVP